MGHSFHTNILPRANVREVLGEVEVAPRPGSTPLPPALPFVTVSRQAGAGATTFGLELVAALNADATLGGGWTLWDKELVDKVTTDHQLATQLVEGFDEGGHSWLANFLGTLPGGDLGGYVDDLKVRNRIAQTVRAVAAAGKTVIIGRGGVFATQRMRGGIHVRLVAPLKWRTAYVAEQLRLTSSQAADWVRRTERRRRTFYRRNWPGQPLDPEAFTVTFNVAQVTPGEMVGMIRSLIAARAPVATTMAAT